MPPRRLAFVFNLTGSEMAFLVLIGLIVLGPEKLPDAVRRFTKAYNEFKKMATGFQGEVKQAFEEPMRELRGTADAVRKAADFDIGLDLGLDTKAKAKGTAATDSKATAGKPAGPARRDGGLNFGNPSAKRQEADAPETAESATTSTETNGADATSSEVQDATE